MALASSALAELAQLVSTTKGQSMKEGLPTSFGLQVGADVGEIVLLVMTDKGLASFLSRSSKLGRCQWRGWPGRGRRRRADRRHHRLHTVQGGLGGLTVSGAVIEPRESWDTDYYGRPVRWPEILVLSNPQADPLRSTMAAIARQTGYKVHKARHALAAEQGGG